MKNNSDLSLNDLIKLLGLKSEEAIRNSIHSFLNEEQTMNLSIRTIQRHLSRIQQYKKNTEVLSQQLNFPTKDDIANIAKLEMQIEEKIDALEDKLDHLVNAYSQGSNKNNPTAAAAGNNQNQQEISELKRLLKMNYLMSLSNIPADQNILGRLEDLRKRVDGRD